MGYDWMPPSKPDRKVAYNVVKHIDHEPPGPSREPCFHCGVKGEAHGTSQFACARWVPAA